MTAITWRLVQASPTIPLLAERVERRRKVSVTSHPSCNFHMRNGITPVMPLRAAGVNVAMGLDDKTINDDEDAVMELRMDAQGASPPHL